MSFLVIFCRDCLKDFFVISWFFYVIQNCKVFPCRFCILPRRHQGLLLFLNHLWIKMNLQARCQNHEQQSKYSLSIFPPTVRPFFRLSVFPLLRPSIFPSVMLHPKTKTNDVTDPTHQLLGGITLDCSWFDFQIKFLIQTFVFFLFFWY